MPYDTLTNDTELISYIANATNQGIYPESNVISVTGPLWLPRIYGKDLTAFEIASSGKIALTIDDVHSLDVYNRAYGNGDPNALITGLNTKSNYALEMSTSNKDVKVYMDSYSNDVYVYALSNVILQASNESMTQKIGKDWNVASGSNMTFTASNGSFQLDANANNLRVILDKAASNLTLYSSSNITVDAKKNFTFTASNHLRGLAFSNVDLTAAYGSFNMSADESNMYIFMDKDTRNMTVYTKSNYTLTADSNYAVTAAKHVSVAATSGSFNVSASNSNMTLKLDAATNDTSLYTKHDFNLTASNDIWAWGKSNVTLTASTGGVSISAEQNNTFITLDVNDDAMIYGLNNVYVSASNDMFTAADNAMSLTTRTGNFSISGHDGAMSLLMDAGTDDVTLDVGHDLIQTIDNNTNLTTGGSLSNQASTGSYSLSAHAGAMTLTMDSANDNTTLYTVNNYKITACNDYLLTAKRHAEITASNGHFWVAAHNSNMVLHMNDVTDNTSMYTKMDFSVIASNHYLIDVDSNAVLKTNHGDIQFNSAASNVFISMEKLTSNLVMSASNNASLSANNNTTFWTKSNMYLTAYGGEFITYSESNLWLECHQDNVYVKMNAADDSINIHGRTGITVTTSNITVSASNNVSFDVKKNVSYTSSNFSVVAESNITLNADTIDIAANSDITYTAQSNYKFIVNASPDDPTAPVFTISGNLVSVRGDMVITGSINTSNIINTTVIQENLKITDKIILLANVGPDTDGLPVDGQATNDGAGIQIDGLPQGVTDSNLYDMFRKSFKWNHNIDGVPGMSNAAYNESYWDLRGGSFRMTRVKNIAENGDPPNLKEVSFTFKINDREELELYKRFWNPVAGEYSLKRVSGLGFTGI